MALPPWPKLKVQDRPQGTKIDLQIDHMAIGCDYEDVARRYPGTISLDVTCHAAFTNAAWCRMVPLLPRLNRLSVTVPWATDLEDLQSIAPFLTELCFLGAAHNAEQHDAARALLRNAHNLHNVDINYVDLIVLADDLPPTVCDINVFSQQGHNASAALQSTLRGLFLRSSGRMRLTASLVTFSLEFVQDAIRHCAMLEISGCDTRESVDVIVKNMLRDRPADRVPSFGYIMFLRGPTYGCNANCVQQDFYNRIDALAATALPMANLPELVAVFLL